MRGDKNAEFHVAVMDYGVKEKYPSFFQKQLVAD